MGLVVEMGFEAEENFLLQKLKVREFFFSSREEIKLRYTHEIVIRELDGNRDCDARVYLLVFIFRL